MYQQQACTKWDDTRRFDVTEGWDWRNWKRLSKRRSMDCGVMLKELFVNSAPTQWLGFA